MSKTVQQLDLLLLYTWLSKFFVDNCSLTNASLPGGRILEANLAETTVLCLATPLCSACSCSYKHSAPAMQ